MHKGEFKLLDLLINAGTSQIYQEPLGAVHVGCDLLIPMLILQRGSPFFELPALFLCQDEHDQRHKYFKYFKYVHFVCIRTWSGLKLQK